MAYDYHQEALAIADELEAQSHAALAEPMRKDVGEGSTATEILMSLRRDLQPVENGATVAPATRSRIRRLIDQIDAALAP